MSGTYSILDKLTALLFSVSLACIAPAESLALNNPGSASNPSAADLDVSLSIPTLFRISGINDLNFGSYSGSGDLVLSDDVCVWTNTATGEYRITASGNGTASAFVVIKVGDPTKVIPYTVRWNDISGTAGNEPLLATETSLNQTGANSVSTGCNSGPAATGNFEVTFTEADLRSVVSGAYAGVLTLVISAPS